MRFVPFEENNTKTVVFSQWNRNSMLLCSFIQLLKGTLQKNEMGVHIINVTIEFAHIFCGLIKIRHAVDEKKKYLKDTTI